MRNLPIELQHSLEDRIIQRQDTNSTWLLEHGYQVLLDHLRKPFNGNLENSQHRLSEMDKRRNINHRDIFPWLYKL